MYLCMCTHMHAEGGHVKSAVPHLALHLLYGSIWGWWYPSDKWSGVVVAFNRCTLVKKKYLILEMEVWLSW